MKLSTKCEMCWKNYRRITYSVKFIGIQKGITHDLNLYNCVKCGTTRVEKVKNGTEARSIK